MKLRQNFGLGDLAKRFKRLRSEVSKILTFWIDAMADHTKDLIPWLPRETIKFVIYREWDAMKCLIFDFP